MNISAELIKLPELFYDINGQTLEISNELIERRNTFYNKIKEKTSTINKESILSELIQNPQYVNLWLLYSSDQRGDTWFFIESKNLIGKNVDRAKGEYIVGRFDHILGYQNLNYFNDNLEACSFFIEKKLLSFI